MINSMKGLWDSRKDAEVGLKAQYGDESALPNQQGTTSNPVYKEIKRHEKFTQLFISMSQRLILFRIGCI